MKIMKCALELQMLAAVKAEENAIAEAARKEAARRELIAKTIAFCEDIGVELEMLANKGKKPRFEFMCSWDLDEVLRATYRDYADRRESYTRASRFDMDTLKEWFANYCFDVQLDPTHGWRYNWGEIRMYRVTILPNAECLK